jgi:hypothetical protein
MRRLFLHSLLFLTTAACLALQAAGYKLADGTTLSGMVVSTNEEGVVIDLGDGNLSKRRKWTEFSQEALAKFKAEFETNPRVSQRTKVIIGGLILRMDPPPNPGATNEMEPPPVPVPEVIKAPRAALTKVEGFERPLADPSFRDALFTPVGILALILALGANFFAAFEIALYKHRPIALVMGVSVLPVIGPLIFFCMPQASPASPKPEKNTRNSAASEVSQKTAAAAAPENPDSVFYRAGEVTINRRFIETKLISFMKMVQTGDAKNLWLAVRTSEGEEYWTQHITKITQEGMTLKTPVENVWDHREVSFFQIQEMEVRRWVAEESS